MKFPVRLAFSCRCSIECRLLSGRALNLAEVDIEVLSDSEYQLLLGKEAKVRLRSGERLEYIAWQLGVCSTQIVAALRFSELPEPAILRLLFDDQP